MTLCDSRNRISDSSPAHFRLSLFTRQHAGKPGPSPLLLDNSWVAYMAALCFGIGDSVLNTQIYALLGKLYSGQVMVRSFTVFQLYQNLGVSGSEDCLCVVWALPLLICSQLLSLPHRLASAVGYYYGLALPMHGKNSSLGQVWVQLALLVVGTVSFGWIDRKAERQRRLKAEAKARQQVIAADTGGGGERYSVNTKDARSGRDTSTA